MAEAQQTSDYPGALDTFVSLTDKEDLAEVSDINKIKAAILAIQTELGIDVAGTQTNLITRLARMMEDDGSLNQGTSFPGSPNEGDIFYRSDTKTAHFYNGTGWTAMTGIDEYVDGTYQDAIAATEQTVSTASTAGLKLKEFTPIIRGGTISCSWECKKTAGTYDAETRVKVNGTFVGSWHTTTSTSYVTVTETGLDVVAGDIITLYGYMPATGLAIYAQNFKILCANPSVSAEVA